MANCTVGACVVATVDALAVVGFTVVGAVDGFTVVACVEAGLVGFVAVASVGGLHRAHRRSPHLLRTGRGSQSRQPSAPRCWCCIVTLVIAFLALG